MTTLLYKWLTKDRKTTYQDSVWPAEVGIWTPDKVPRMCASGWHLATHQGISEHAKVNCVLWVAEGRGVSVEDSSKIAFESARLVTEIGVLEPTVATKWAADCAKRVLKNYEDVYPNDFRPREAIKAAKKWAKEPTEENRNACNAAADAAYAAYAAADAAAYNAAYAAYAAAYAACNACNAAVADAAYAADAAAYAAADAAAYNAAYAAYAAAYAACNACNAAVADAAYAAYNAANAAYNAAYAAYAAAYAACNACNAAVADAAYAADAAAYNAANAAYAKEKERIWQSDKLLTLMRRSNA